LQAACVVVKILIRMAGKEQDASRNVQNVAANSPGNEPMNGTWRDAFGDAEHTQVEQANSAKKQRQPDIIQNFSGRPEPRFIDVHEVVQATAADELFPRGDFIHDANSPLSGQGPDSEQFPPVRVFEEPAGNDEAYPTGQRGCGQPFGAHRYGFLARFL